MIIRAVLIPLKIDFKLGRRCVFVAGSGEPFLEYSDDDFLYGFGHGADRFEDRPGGRRDKESYNDIAETLMPDVLVEDDCESIGGAEQMTITWVRPDIKNRIKSIVVKENGGIDHLPDNISSL